MILLLDVHMKPYWGHGIFQTSAPRLAAGCGALLCDDKSVLYD